MGRFQDRVAVVTGGAQGMGRAVAERLLDEGASVVIGDVDGPLARRTASELASTAPDRAIAVEGDVASRSDVRAMVAAAVDTFGRLDVMVAHAGVGTFQPFFEHDESTFESTLAVNLVGAFLCIQEAAVVMKEQGGGAIVNLASIMGFSGGLFPNPAYQAAKGAVVNLTRALALEFAPHRIRVNAVAPTFVRTDLTAPVFGNPEVLKRVMEHTPLGVLPEVEDIARAILFLASGAARCVTGVTLPVDSGYLAR